MSDYIIPPVDESDVRRVVERDFSEDTRTEAYDLLSSQKWPPAYQSRVSLAILKLAHGSIDELRRQLKIAQVDIRDVMAPAESPRFCRIGFVGYGKLTPESREKLQSTDYEEYRAWLQK